MRDNKPLQSTALRVTTFASFSVAAANVAPLRAATERRRYGYIMNKMIFVLGALLIASGCAIKHDKESINNNAAISSLEKSDEYKENINWHLFPRKNTMRISSFLNNNTKIAMHCEVQFDVLSPNAFRERNVYDWAVQNHHEYKVDFCNIMKAKEIINNMPPSSLPNISGKAIIISIDNEYGRKLYCYDSSNIPDSIKKLQILVKAWPYTRDEP